MAGRTFAIGPARLDLPELPPLLAAPLTPFLVAAPASYSLVLQDHAPVPLGDPTVPLPQIAETPEGFSLQAAGLEAAYFRDRRELRVARAGSTGELASALRWLLAYALLESDIVLVHGVGLVSGRAGCAFTGRSGAGKSTLGATSGLLCAGDELIGVSADGQLYGTPWNVGVPVSAPLKLVGLLSWSNEPSLSPLVPSHWLQTAAENVLLPVPTAEGRARVFRILSAMLARVKVRTLAFPPDSRTGALLAAELS